MSLSSGVTLKRLQSVLLHNIPSSFNTHSSVSETQSPTAIASREATSLAFASFIATSSGSGILDIFSTSPKTSALALLEKRTYPASTENWQLISAITSSISFSAPPLNISSCCTFYSSRYLIYSNASDKVNYISLILTGARYVPSIFAGLMILLSLAAVCCGRVLSASKAQVKSYSF